MKHIIYALLLFVLPTLTIFSQVKKTSTPKWVSKIEYNKKAIQNDSLVDNGIFNLLYEHQINETTKEFFYRSATKIIENVGVQSSSAINILYDPTYQELAFHSIYIIRDGKYIDKLSTTEFQLVRRELNSENYIYDGTLSAMTNLSDVRVGDIIEYSYSIKGSNPIYKNKFFYSFYLNDYQPLSRIHLSILSRKNFDFTYLNTDNKFSKTTENGKNKYIYSNTNVALTDYDSQIPSSKFQYEMAFVSELKNWKQVIDWGINVFNVNASLSRPLLRKINEIKTKYKTDGERIDATLNFVQDDVRYLGLESGIGAYKPFSSNKVFKQLYGDCKDKSLLMSTMLGKMNIEAYPMLVNTYLKETVTTLPPSPTVFNHCVVKVVDKESGVFYYDPTIANQGGSFDTNAFPDYKYGLVLQKDNTELDQLYSITNNNIEIIDYYELEEVGKGATLKTTTTYYDGEADYMRGYFKNNSIVSVKKEFEKFYANYFYNVKSTKALEYKDDLEQNKFIVFEEYKIDSIWENSISDNQITVSFQPYTIINSMVMPEKRDRNTPFALSYPLARTQTIKVKLPEKWNITNENYSVDSPNFFYDFDVKYKEQQDLLVITHNLKNLKDHVNPEEFPAFYDEMKKIDLNMAYNLIIDKDYKSASSGNWLEYLGIFIFILVFAAAIIAAVKVYKYDPEVKMERYFENDKPIGGWLVLVGIGLCLSPIRVLINMFEGDAALINGTWITFFSSDYQNYNIALGFVAFAELLVNVSLLVFLILYIFLFFKKRTSFPKLYAFTLIGLLVFTILDTMLVNKLYNLETSLVESREILSSFIRTGLIASYLLLSERVKETFVNRLK